MTDPCPNLGEFIDGELSPEDADEVRDHLADCVACQRALHGLMQLGMLADECRRARERAGSQATDDPARAPDGRPRLVVIPGQSPGGPGTKAEEGRDAAVSPGDELAWAHWRRRVVTVATASMVAAAAAACVMLYRAGLETPGGPDRDWVAQLGDTRTLEARLSHRSATGHRRYSPARAEVTAAGRIPIARLDQLERSGDHHGLAIAWLLDGQIDRARLELEKAGDSVDVRSDLAAMLLAKDRYREALDVLRNVLRESPGHGPARWNRALTLEALGLSLSAAAEFERVADGGEPGWAEEARERAASLRRVTRARRDATEEALRHAREMVLSGQPVALDIARAHPGYARMYFYDALRVAPSAEVVQRFRPLAELLDQHHGGEVLRRHVDRVASADFTRRAPLAQAYRALYQSLALAPEGSSKDPRSGQDIAQNGSQFPGPSADPWRVLLAALRDRGEAEEGDAIAGPGPLDDILLGALLRSRRQVAGPALRGVLARQSGDPWFLALEYQRRAEEHQARSEPLAAEQALLDAWRICREQRLSYLWARIGPRLAELYSHLRRMPRALEITRVGLERSRRLALWHVETRFIQILAQAHRYRGEVSMAEAHANEILLRVPEDRSPRCQTRRFAHAELAGIYMHLLETRRARVHMDALQRCDSAVASPLEAATLAHLIRLDPRPGDRDALSRYLARLRGEGSSPGDRALADQIAGVALIHRAETRSSGQAHLRRAITAAGDLFHPDPDRSMARSLSYAELVMDAGRHGAFAEALALLAEEIDALPPETCALGVAVTYERDLAVARGPSGRIVGHYRGDRRSPTVDVTTLVPGPLREVLADCSLIDVLARPPLIGKSEFLPVEQAWRFRVSRNSPVPPPSGGPGRRLVVAAVDAPRSLGLPRLGVWNDIGRIPGESVTTLLGAMATPAAVRRAMPQASVIEIHSHGLVESGVSDAATLVLAPGGGDPESGSGDAPWALTEREIRGTKLRGHPLVLLGACHAAVGAPYNYKTWSLPAAFLDAGARAVIASPTTLPDASVETFFAAIRRRIRDGESPAVALRNERVRDDAEPWQRAVVVFE